MHTNTQTTHTLTQAQRDTGIHSGIIQPIWKEGQKRGDGGGGVREDVRAGQMERESGVGRGERKCREEEQKMKGGGDCMVTLVGERKNSGSPA